MPITHLVTPTPDLMLDTLELVSLGSVSSDEIAARLRRSPLDRAIGRRVDTALQALATEGLVTPHVERGRLVHTCRPAGLDALEVHGRFANVGTVLFTDLVGSTELIGRYGEDGAHERRLRHFALLRDAILTTGGREVKSLGDGLMVVFADPSAAMECAQQMQRSVALDDDQLGLRIGLHTGELLREDDDFHGTTVIIAARLCNTAEAGQIIMSNATHDITDATRSRPAQSLGQLALKGLAQPVAACSLWWSQRATPGTPIAAA